MQKSRDGPSTASCTYPRKLILILDNAAWRIKIRKIWKFRQATVYLQKLNKLREVIEIRGRERKREEKKSELKLE